MFKTVTVDVDVHVDIEDVLEEMTETDLAECGLVKVANAANQQGSLRAHVDAMRLAARQSDMRRFCAEAEKVADSFGVILDTSPLLEAIPA